MFADGDAPDARGPTAPELFAESDAPDA